MQSARLIPTATCLAVSRARHALPASRPRRRAPRRSAPALVQHCVDPAQKGRAGPKGLVTNVSVAGFRTRGDGLPCARSTACAKGSYSAGNGAACQGQHSWCRCVKRIGVCSRRTQPTLGTEGLRCTHLSPYSVSVQHLLGQHREQLMHLLPCWNLHPVDWIQFLVQLCWCVHRHYHHDRRLPRNSSQKGTDASDRRTRGGALYLPVHRPD